MELKKKLLMSASALLLSTGLAFASPVTDAIVADLEAQNATSIRVKVGLFSIKVEAIIDGAKVERSYTLEGVLRKEERKENGSETKTYYDEAGNIVTVKTESDDDDDDDHKNGDDDDDSDDDSDDNSDDDDDRDDDDSDDDDDGKDDDD